MSNATFELPPTEEINIDGYKIDLSAGALGGQALVYDAGSNTFIAADAYGTVSGSFIAQQVAYSNGTFSLTGNSNFIFDDAYNALKILGDGYFSNAVVLNDIRIYRSGTKALTIDDGYGGSVNTSTWNGALTASTFNSSIVQTDTINQWGGGAVTLWASGTGDITIGNATRQFIVANNILPTSNNAYSLGSSSAKWKDGYFAGKISLDGYTIDLSAGATTNQVLTYNGTSFVAQNSTGGISGTLTNTKVPYATGTSTIADSGMAWDNTNKILTVTTLAGNDGVAVTDGTRSLGLFVNYNSAAVGALGTTSNHDLVFFTNSASAQMTLSTSGNLGIGVSPSYKLDVNGDIHISANRLLIDASSAAVSPSGMGAIRFNTGNNHLEFSENGGAYVQFGSGGGSMSIGGSVSGGTTKSVLYVDGSSNLAQDNSNFAWDFTNHRLGIGINTPSTPLEISRGDSDLIKLTNTSASLYADMIWYDSSNALKGGIGYGNASATFRTSKNFLLTLTDYVITDDTTNFYALTKTTGQHTFTQPVNTSGSPIILQVTGAANTTLAAGTEAIDGYFKLDRQVQFATGALTTQRAVYISPPTYKFVGASTLTNAATFAIGGAPIQGTNATLTNTYSMWVQGGISRLDGQFVVGASSLNNATVAAKFVNNVSGAGTVYIQNIHSSGVSQLELYDNSNSFHSAYGYANAGGGSYIYNQSGDAFSIQQNGNHAIHITSSSLVGINTSSINNNLAVNGNMAIGNSYTNTAAPSNGLIVQGVTVIGATSATAAQNLEVRNANGNGAGGQFAMRNTLSTGQSELDVFDSAGTFRLSEGFDNNSIGTNPTAYYYTGTSTDFLQQTNNGANLTCYRSDGAWTFNASSHSGATNTAATQHLATFFKDYTYPGDTTASQIAVAGKTDPTKIMAIGMDTNTANGFGYIQASKQGTAATYLALQPAGGTVTIGATTATTPLAFLFVGTSSTDGVGTIKNTSTTGYSNIRFEKSDGTFEGSIGFANASAGITHLQGLIHLYSGGPDYVVANATAIELKLGATNTQAFIEWNAGASAAVSASSRGRIRYNGSTQHFEISENGAAYKNFMRIGDPVTSGTSGSIPYIDSSSNLAQDNANLFWDATNKSLGIGVAPSTNTLSVKKSLSGGSIVAIQNSNTAGYSSIIFNDSSTVQKGSIGYANASTGGSIQGLNYLYSPNVDWVMSDATTNWFRWYTASSAYGFEMASGSSATVSLSNTGKIRYNSSTQLFQVSRNGAAYVDDIAGNLTATRISFASAAGTLTDDSSLVWDNTNKRLSLGTGASPVAQFDQTQVVATTGSPTGQRFVGAAHTTLTASAEATDGYWKLDRTVQFTGSATPAAANITTQRAMYISAPTYAFSNTGAQTITNAATLAIGDAPQAGSHATITNAYSLWVQNGLAAFDNHIKVDGYKIDLSGGATINNVLQYDGTKFVAATNSGRVVIYWDASEPWSSIYTKIGAAVAAGVDPTVIIDSSFNQTIPSGTYTGANINNTVFYSAYSGGITVDSGATITGDVVLTLINVSLTCDGYLTQADHLVNVELVGLAQIYNLNATDPVFPQMNGGAGLTLTNGFANPTGGFLGTDGAPVFDIKTANTYFVYITNSPGGLTGAIAGNAVLGGAGDYQVAGDATSLYKIDSSNLAGSATYTSGYPLAYPSVLAHYTTGALPSPTNLPTGTTVIDTTVPAIAVVIAGAWKKTTLS